MMKKIMQPCGLHCIKMQDIGVTIGEQNILQHVKKRASAFTVRPRSSVPTMRP